MNDKTGRNRGPRRAAALAVAAAVAVLATACGARIDLSPASPAPAGSATFAQELALAQCMRGHGVPDFPDPAAAGGFHVSAGARSPAARCRPPTAPAGTCWRAAARPSRSCSGRPSRNSRSSSRRSPRCEVRPVHAQPRRAGLPRPAGERSTAPRAGQRGIKPDSPQFQAAVTACQDVLPARGAPVSVGNARRTQSGSVIERGRPQRGRAWLASSVACSPPGRGSRWARGGAGPGWLVRGRAGGAAAGDPAGASGRICRRPRRWPRPWGTPAPTRCGGRAAGR